MKRAGYVNISSSAIHPCSDPTPTNAFYRTGTIQILRKSMTLTIRIPATPSCLGIDLVAQEIQPFGISSTWSLFILEFPSSGRDTVGRDSEEGPNFSHILHKEAKRPLLWFSLPQYFLRMYFCR